MRLKRTIIEALDQDCDGSLSLAANNLDEMDETTREKVLTAIGRNVTEHIRTEVKSLGQILSQARPPEP
jgi:hypothetical protein